MIEPAPAAELFLHKACSARLLGERYGWNNFGSGALFEAMDKTDAEHRSIAEAPGVAQEVALAMLHSAPCLERFPVVVVNSLDQQDPASASQVEPPKNSHSQS